jgi:peptidoglycan/xylan/chitin deacetylase (PgdA/CDA1 family)
MTIQWPNWDPVWGPRPAPKPQGLRRSVKKLAAFLRAIGRSANDPSRGVAILAYHGTGGSGDPWWLDFKGQMSLLEDLGYRIVSLDSALEWVRSGEPAAEPTAVITFDDGFANNLDHAFPELARRGWPATVFVTTGYLGRRPYLMKDEVVRLQDFGLEIGNHTHSHRSLPDLSEEEIRAELLACGQRLEDLTGQRPRHFLYPNGQYNPVVCDVVASSGMQSACTGRIGFNDHSTDCFRLRRLTLERADGRRELRARLAGGYDFLDARYRHMDRVA